MIYVYFSSFAIKIVGLRLGQFLNFFNEQRKQENNYKTQNCGKIVVHYLCVGHHDYL